jgi:myo-inositol-1(or 4)-monophosphatase
MGGRPVGGVVVCPATGERWWATRGGGAWKNGCPVRVSEIGSVDRALVGTGFPFKRLDLLSAYVVQFEAMVRAGAAVRRAGAAALDLCYLAEGRFDAFWELVLNPWDFAAGVLVIEEAGGVVCRVDGSSLELTQGPVAAANSRGLLEKMLEILGGTARLYPDL